MRAEVPKRVNIVAHDTQVQAPREEISNFAELAVVQHRLHTAHRPVVEEGVSHHERDTGGLGRSAELFSFSSIRCQWLLN